MVALRANSLMIIGGDISCIQHIVVQKVVAPEFFRVQDIQNLLIDGSITLAITTNLKAEIDKN